MEAPAPSPPGAGGSPHFGLLYEGPWELARHLARCVEAASARREATVLVHAFPSEDATAQFLQSARADHRALAGRGLLRCVPRREALERGRRPDAAAAEAFLAAASAEARDRGWSGARVIVDAGRAYLAEGRGRAWLRLEERLAARPPPGPPVACAYPGAVLASPTLGGALARVHGGVFATLRQGAWPPAE